MIKNKKSTEIDALTEATPRLITFNKRSTLQTLKSILLTYLKPLFSSHNEQVEFDELMNLKITQNLPVE
jgi:hypothetical protein